MRRKAQMRKIKFIWNSGWGFIYDTPNKVEEIISIPSRTNFVHKNHARYQE